MNYAERTNSRMEQERKGNANWFVRIDWTCLEVIRYQTLSYSSLSFLTEGESREKGSKGYRVFFQAESDSATLDGAVERAFSATPPRQSLIKAEYPAEHLHLHLGSAGADSPAFSSLFAAGTFNASLIAARRRWNGFYTGERPRFEYNRFQGGSINRGRAAFQSGTRENKFSRGVVGYCPTPRDAYSKSADTFYLLPSLSSN